MEFERRDAMDGVDGLINEASFAELLLMHAQIPEKRQKVMLKRVKRKFKSAEGISFDEVRRYMFDLASRPHTSSGCSDARFFPIPLPH